MIQDTNRRTCRGFVVSGRVQGVGFRAATRETAQRLELAGWVRNRSDGCVEGVAFGTAAQLEPFTEWLNQGPAMARVDSVWHSDAVEDDTLSTGFEIR
ncbi:acylphosphatase [uncultured Abyssibacter sp.]|uniref:acylphosphatase n=1 Tax=uncultured Abyssibacter sp. TaxID=2320202 RepID=UPI0032B1ACF5|tara:strand:- start:157 stop:450 length:294 start_codon:yes stop_codon:yes gene_type:complete